jgi:hypothetical protein
MIVVWTRSILSGWTALLLIAYGVERPLLHWSAALIGVSWIATAHLAFDCLTLAVAAWVTGRTNRARAIWAALVFAVTLSFFDFGGALALNVPWLLRLIFNSFHDSRFLDSLATSVETHVLLFGCLFAGAMLSRPRERPVSIR